MHSTRGIQTSLWMGCPIRNLRAHRSHAAPPERFAGLRVLHRPSAPGHPPRTRLRLSSLVSLAVARALACSPDASPRSLASTLAHTRFKLLYLSRVLFLILL